MKKFFKSFGCGLGFFGIFLLIQAVISFMLNFIISFIVGYNAAKNCGDDISYEKIQEIMDISLQTYSKYLISIIIVCWIITIFVYFLIFKMRNKKFLKEVNLLNINSNKNYIPLMIISAVGFSLTVLFIMSAFIPENILEEYNESMGYIQSFNFSSLLLILVVAPICEEITFRGLMLSRFQKGMPIVVAVILQSVFFALSHGNVFQMAYAFIMGIILGFMVIKYKSILVTIIFHVTFNFVGSIGFLCLSKITNHLVLFFIYIIGILVAIVSLVSIFKVDKTESINSDYSYKYME